MCVHAMLTDYSYRYPDYKYSPRRRETASKKAKRSNSSKAGALQTVASNVDYQPRIQQTDLSSAEQTGTTFAHPLQAVDVTIALSNDLDDDTSTAATCYDSLLLCPTLYEPSYHDPSASPSTFSMMSQFSGLSPSLSSDYEPTAALHYPEYYNSLGVHPYFCGSASDTYMPPSYECVPFFDYSSQMDQVAIPFDVYDAPIADLMPPQLVFPETQRQLPPAILDHTQPMLQDDSQDTVHNLDFGSFNNTYALASETPLLTQSFVFIDYETMPY